MASIRLPAIFNAPSVDQLTSEVTLTSSYQTLVSVNGYGTLDEFMVFFNNQNNCLIRVVIDNVNFYDIIPSALPSDNSFGLEREGNRIRDNFGSIMLFNESIELQAKSSSPNKIVREAYLKTRLLTNGPAPPVNNGCDTVVLCSPSGYKYEVTVTDIGEIDTILV